MYWCTVQNIARLVCSNPNRSVQRRIALLPATLFCIGSCRGGLRTIGALLVMYILLTIFLAEVNDIGKYAEMILFI